MVAPLPEPELPRLHQCLRNHFVFLMNAANDFNPIATHVDMVRRDNPEQAYMIDHTMDSINLDTYGPNSGRIFFAFRLPRIGDGIFRLPAANENPERVAIKCLNINAVVTALRGGSFEDPYRAINRMQTIGDNIHVLGCIEALKDEDNLYIVMPYCEGGSLDEVVDAALPEAHALSIFLQILDCLTYLRDRQICHRNLSPVEFIFYQGRVMINGSGLGQSFQLPPTGASVVIPDVQRHGTFAFQPPEVYELLPYHIYQCDLWAAALTFFYLLTSEVLYQVPHITDPAFQRFIVAQGITGEENNRIMQALADGDLVEQEFHDLADAEARERHVFRLRQARRLRPVFATIQLLTREVREILSNLLMADPGDRWDLDMARAATLNVIHH